MATFKDVQIEETFYISRTGTACKKLSETTAVGLRKELCGFDWQDVRDPSPETLSPDERVYGVGEAY